MNKEITINGKKLKYLTVMKLQQRTICDYCTNQPVEKKPFYLYEDADGVASFVCDQCASKEQ